MRQRSMDAGERWMLTDVLGQTIRGWDTRGHNVRSEYDALRRPLALFVLGTDPVNSDPRTLAGEVLFDRTIYGEGQPNDQALNLRTRVFQHRDTAGLVSNVFTDPVTGTACRVRFQGQLAREQPAVRRRLQAAAGLGTTGAADACRGSCARARATTRSTASSRRGRRTAASRIRPSTSQVCSNVSKSTFAAPRTPTTFVGNVDYDSRGRRKSIDYGNALNPSARTAYVYDPLTFRLTNVKTTRPGFPAAERLAQNLSYTFDPTGNITHTH